jgi:uncharacterized protein
MKLLYLSAEWRKILLINYVVDPEILLPYLPPRTEFDLYEGKCLVSLAGFVFQNLKFLEIPIPYHQKFEEFNLRFYVVYKQNGQILRGVVFIREYVPKRFFKVLANAFAHEKYECYSMKHSIEEQDDLMVSYSFKVKENWNSVSAAAKTNPIIIEPGSLEDFIAEHYYGYNKWTSKVTLEYQLGHPRWSFYPLKSFSVDCRFEDYYPQEFLPFLYREAHSAQLIEGSAVRLYPGRFI